MAIRKALKLIWLFLTAKNTERDNDTLDCSIHFDTSPPPSIKPLVSRGFARDRAALAQDAAKVRQDMQRGWEKTKQRHL